MSRRVQHHHLAWDDMPLVRPAARRRSHGLPLFLIAFAAGMIVGLLIR